MECLVLVARPHGNIRRQLWRLKREAFDWNRDDASMALPEGFVCGWFAPPKFPADRRSRQAFSERIQETLSRHADRISAALPDTLHFSSTVEENGQVMLKLDDGLDVPELKASLERFALDAGLETCAGVPYAQRGIWLGSKTPAPVSLSFKKYELVLYLAELPETPFGGFQFRTVARVHRKVKADPRTRGKTAIKED